MSKGTAFVVGYSIFLLILFSGMCYLMSTVNPPPLTIDEHKANGTRRFLDLNLKSLIVDTPAVSDNAEYGLEKVRDNQYIPLYTYPRHQYTAARIDGFNGPDIFETETVQPPVWPPQIESRNVIHLPIVIVDENDRAKLKFETASIKTYRRSVNKDDDDSTAAIIFKIMHGDGKPRIEIKLADGESKNIEQNQSYLKFHMSVPYDSSKSTENPKLSDNRINTMISTDTVVIYDVNSTISNKKNYIGDKTSNSEEKVTNNISEHSTEDKNIKLHSDTYRKPQKYTLNGSLKINQINVQNVSHSTKS